MCRFELGWDPKSGKRLVSKKSIHTTPIRKIDTRRGEGKKNTNNNDGKNEKNTPNYSFKSLSIGQTDYPFPSGLYLGRLLSPVARWQNQEDYQKNDPIIELVSNNYVPPNTKTKKNSVFGNKFPKEISESMAMVDAVERALKLLIPANSFFNNDSHNNNDCCVRVYCVGDGLYPITASTMALNFPLKGWEFISIDPILEPLTLSGTRWCDCIIQFKGLSQDYRIPEPPTLKPDNNDDEVQYLDLVIACHSHAPLQEFWDRIVDTNRKKDYRHRAIAITMPCCANFSALSTTPILSFSDYEVYSPKRLVNIYSDYPTVSVLK